MRSACAVRAQGIDVPTDAERQGQADVILPQPGADDCIIKPFRVAKDRPGALPAPRPGAHGVRFGDCVDLAARKARRGSLRADSEGARAARVFRALGMRPVLTRS
jgi:hypothetical protein